VFSMQRIKKVLLAVAPVAILAMVFAGGKFP
jgi:hypothetical protein